MLAVSLLLTCFFLFASSIKIFAWQTLIFKTQLSFFNKYGLSRTHMFLVGLLELLASLLLISALVIGSLMLQSIAALIIAFTSIGAIYFHLRFDTVRDAIPAIVTLGLSMSLIMITI